MPRVRCSYVPLIWPSFVSNLERILKKVTKIHKDLTSKRWYDRVLAALLFKSYASVLKECHDRLNWTMQEFNVSALAP